MYIYERFRPTFERDEDTFWRTCELNQHEGKLLGEVLRREAQRSVRLAF